MILLIKTKYFFEVFRQTPNANAHANTKIIQNLVIMVFALPLNNKYFYNVKKIVTTNNDLLVSLASKGDPVAFHALVSPSLESNYVKMRLNGKSHSDVCKILFPDTLSLFNELKKSPVPNNFDEWVNEQNLIAISEQESESQKLTPEQMSAVNVFNTELQRYLVKMTSNRKHPRISSSAPIFVKPWFKNMMIGCSVVLVLLALYFILFFSNTAIVLMFKTENTEYKISYPFVEKTTPINQVKIDSTIIDSISKVKDSIIKALEDTLEKERAEVKTAQAQKKIAEQAVRHTPKPPKPPKPIAPPKPVEPPPQQEYSSYTSEPETAPIASEPVLAPVETTEPESNSAVSSSETESTPFSE